RDIPIVRLVDPALTTGMVEYVVYHVLRFHRRMDLYENQQRNHVWCSLPQSLPENTTVGIMGMGVLGSASATALHRMGLKVLGWSRTRKMLAGVESYAGLPELPQFLSRSQIVVLLLPLTEETSEIMNASCFAQLPLGSFLVNAGRGGLVVEGDLIAALDSGRIAGAALDVFSEEPLPSDHRFWSDPAVVLTPHIASITNPNSASAIVTSNICRYRAGLPMNGLVTFELSAS
ncbi:MAG: glyoxylate/hydroxypyruvate reductase A, partial [Candidatus Poribacteria bacterium]|nr:glyoxylate/hydroxypyruvate reductase A [Candidatus Poribacteria bacterium]